MNKGLILVFTGNGKGKTTAAFGVAMRTLGRGGKVGVVQFFKRAKSKVRGAKGAASWHYAPCSLPSGCGALDKEGAFRALEKFNSRFHVWSFGGGFTWKVPRAENAKAVRKAWKKCRELLTDPKYNLIILDEIHIALKYKFLKTAEVIKALKQRSAAKHVILTGRGAPQAIIRLADLVTEMKCVKHPFTRGVLAQAGIDF